MWPRGQRRPTGAVRVPTVPGPILFVLACCVEGGGFALCAMGPLRDTAVVIRYPLLRVRAVNVEMLFSPGQRLSAAPFGFAEWGDVPSATCATATTFAGQAPAADRPVR